MTKKKLERTDFPERSMVLWIRQVNDQKYWKNPKIFIFKEKYGTRYFLVHNFADLGKVSLKILTERIEYWYDDNKKFLAMAKAACKNKDGWLAFALLTARIDAEYEGFEEEIPEQF